MANAIHFVNANGLKFAYLEKGSGPSCSCFTASRTPHGHGTTFARESPPKDTARSAHSCAGINPSAIPDRDPDQETLARDALALIETLGARDAIIVGHDWGASAAYGAALGPDRVKKLIVVGSPQPAAAKPSLKKLWALSARASPTRRA